MNNVKVKGIYTVEKKYDLVWLKEAGTESNQSMNYFNFEKILYQAFTDNQIKVILDEINCMRKVILDFDKGVAKKVIDKDPNFLEAMLPYFNAKRIQQQLDDPFAEEYNAYIRE